jgi:esterase/lipase
MKKKIFIIILIFIISLIILFAVGPRAKINDKINKISLPEDLDKYLKDSESKNTNLKENVEKKIIWLNKDKRKTPRSIVFIHGFSATRQEIAPVCEIVAKKLGCNLFYTRLTAHGEKDGEAFATVTTNDWFNDAYEAVEIAKRIGDKVIIITCSTGAPLTVWLMQREPKIESVALISANFKPREKESDILLLPWGNLICKILVGKYNSWVPKNELHGQYWTYKYRSESLLPMMALTKYSRKIDYSSFKIPALFVYSEKDEVVDISWIKKVYEKYGGKKKLVDLPGAPGHDIAGYINSPETTDILAETIIDFVK